MCPKLAAKKDKKHLFGGLTMNYNQNHKISQITSETLIVEVDIAKHNHVARAQDFRGLELGKTCFFEN